MSVSKNDKKIYISYSCIVGIWWKRKAFPTLVNLCITLLKYLKATLTYRTGP